ncbi:MAG: cupredoxin domain-containing protein [Deltaproteobacteria bacterium]|nr:cupredoxin domain-containing protein [Deltaproteobacteria bacterium]
MRGPLLVVIAVALGLVACSKKSGTETKETKQPPAATTATGTVNPDGVRKIAIEAGKEGYVPDKIPGKPGEKLMLVFTRTVEGECLAELKTPDGKLVVLPMNSPVEVAVTVPQDGEVRFACGMDMFTGTVVAQKS